MISLWIFIVLLIHFFGYPNEEKEYNKFHESQINGIISYNYASSGGVKIKINKEENVRYVYLKYNYELESFFSSFVVNGDSISKASNGDYLYLFRKNHVYRFKTNKR